ncbi:MAG: nucleoid-associated protein [Streptococcus sp.]|nr:nucleoid-associated protein [Streptococcus sp.]
MLDSYLKKILIHQFTPQDTEIQFSENYLTITPEIDIYFRKKLEKVFSSEAKRGILALDNVFWELLTDDLKITSKNIVDLWREEFIVSDNQKANELIFIEFEKDGSPYVAFLRIALKPSFVHMSEADINIMAKTENNFPSASQVPDDAIVINKNTREYYLFEKRIKQDGKLRLYFSENLLQDKPGPSLSSTIKTLETTAFKIAENFQKNDFDFQAKVKLNLHQQLEEDNLSPEELAEQLFEDHLTAKLSFVEEVKPSLDKEVKLSDIDTSKSIKRLETQKLSLSNGIEMVVPNAIYQDAESVEFIQNSDGTYSILIKNIQDIKNK